MFWNWRICTYPSWCTILNQRNEDLISDNARLLGDVIRLQEQLQQCESGNIPPVPVVPPPSSLVSISGQEYESMIREIKSSILVYIDDTEYKLPPIEEVKLFILHMAVYQGLWLENEYDCDDFTLVLNAEFAKHEGWRWTPRSDCWYQEIFGSHSAMLLGATDEDMNKKLYLIEGQESEMSVAVREANTYLKNKNPWLVK